MTKAGQCARIGLKKTGESRAHRAIGRSGVSLVRSMLSPHIPRNGFATAKLKRWMEG